MLFRFIGCLGLLLPVVLAAAVANQQGRLLWQESQQRSWTTVATTPKIVNVVHENERSRALRPDLQIELTVIDQPVTLNLFLTRPSLSSSFIARTFELDGTVTTSSELQNCLYTGYVGNVNDGSSYASVNYCDDGQLNGFWFHHGEQYTISPRSPSKSKRSYDGGYQADDLAMDSLGNIIHYVSRVKSEIGSAPSCGTVTDKGKRSKPANKPGDLLSVAANVAKTASGSEAAQNGTAVTVNMYVVMDQSMVAIYGSDTENWGTQLINAASQLLANGNNGFDPDLQLELITIDIWRSNQIAVTPNGPSTLESFCRWAMDQDIDYDVALLLTYVDISASSTDIVGIAYLETACTKAGCALVEDLGPSALSLTSQTVIHETGHTLGAVHDGVDNSCPQGQFIMSPVQSDATQWSSCSIQEINSYVSSSFTNADFCQSMPINVSRASAQFNVFATFALLTIGFLSISFAQLL